MDIQIDLRRGDFEAMHPKAKLFGFDEDRKLYTGDSVESINDQWTTWCACIGMLCLDGKEAQAVPDLGELQERIAGHQYYHDEHGHMVVDMDDVVKEISGFDSWKAQAVPEGFVLVKKELPEQIAEKMAIDRIDKPRHENDPVWSEIAEQAYKDQVKSKKWEFWRDYKAMIEAQEPAND